MTCKCCKYYQVGWYYNEYFNWMILTYGESSKLEKYHNSLKHPNGLVVKKMCTIEEALEAVRKQKEVEPYVSFIEEAC